MITSRNVSMCAPARTMVAKVVVPGPVPTPAPTPHRCSLDCMQAAQIIPVEKEIEDHLAQACENAAPLIRRRLYASSVMKERFDKAILERPLRYNLTRCPTFSEARQWT